MSRDPYFTSMQTTPPRSVVTNNATANNSFPTIGTFSLESTSPQPNQIFSQPDFFTNSNQSNSMNGGINGGSNHSSSSSTIFNQTNNNSNNSGGGGGTDPNGATRETGIIEKLLVGVSILKISN